MTSTLFALVVGCLSIAFVQPASAQNVHRKFKDTIAVIQRKPVLQKGRLDVTPELGASFNDAIVQTFKLGVGANFHFSERVYAGLLFDWYNFGTVFGGPTTAYEAVSNQTRTSADGAQLNWDAGLEVGFSPLVGKFALFNRAILYYTLSVTAGGVWMNSQSIALPTSHGSAGGTVSVQNRIFLNKWLALHLALRDTIFSAELKGASAALTNVVTFGLGVSMFLPTSFHYSDASNSVASAH